MDLRLRQLIRQYSITPHDVQVEYQLFIALVRVDLIPRHWLRLLAFLGENNVCNLPPELQPPTGVIERLYELTTIEEEEEEPWERWRMINLFPFNEHNLFDNTRPLAQQPFDHTVVVYLVGCYLRQTFAWLFNESSQITEINHYNRRRRKQRGAPTNTLHQLKTQTRKSVVSLLTWVPGAKVIELNWAWADIIGTIADENDLIPNLEPGENYYDREADNFYHALVWLLQLMNNQIAFPNRHCSKGCSLWDVDTPIDISPRRKTCPLCRAPLIGPHTNFERMTLAEGPEAFTDAYPFNSIITAAYAVWRHSEQPVEVLHSQILPFMRRRIISLVI